MSSHLTILTNSDNSQTANWKYRTSHARKHSLNFCWFTQQLAKLRGPGLPTLWALRKYLWRR